MKIDLHTHSYYSRDAICSPKELIKTALVKGLDGIALTDHDTTKGWDDALKAAKELNAVVVLGEEIKIKKQGKTVGEILGYFLKEEIDPQGKNVEEIITEIREQGGIAIIAHPFHQKKPFQELEEHKHSVDGIEIFNARSQNKKGNQKALNFAQENNLATTAGSDAHSCFEIGKAFIEVEAEDQEELKQAILDKKIKISGEQSSFFVQIFAGIGKFIHLFWQPK